MINQTERRPYAATANLMAIFNRVRTRNLPPSLNNEFLRIAGVPEAALGRVTQALEFLGLINADRSPSDSLRAMAAASDAEFVSLLAATVREAYADDFSAIDPAQDSQAQIIDAFRRYEPRSQTSRMVMFFLGICREAGIPVRDVPRERQMQSGNRRAATGRPSPRVVKAPSGAVSRVSGPGSGASGSAFFGLAEEDMSNLTEQEFSEVWTALGKVAQAKFRAAREAKAEPHQEVDNEDAEGDA